MRSRSLRAESRRWSMSSYRCAEAAIIGRRLQPARIGEFFLQTGERPRASFLALDALEAARKGFGRLDIPYARLIQRREERVSRVRERRVELCQEARIVNREQRLDPLGVAGDDGVGRGIVVAEQPLCPNGRANVLNPLTATT